MRYTIEPQTDDPNALVEVVNAEDSVRVKLLREHTASANFVDDLRDVIREHRAELDVDGWYEENGVRVDIVDQQELKARFAHVNMLAVAARAIELELFGPEVE